MTEQAQRESASPPMVAAGSIPTGACRQRRSSGPCVLSRSCVVEPRNPVAPALLLSREGAPGAESVVRRCPPDGAAAALYRLSATGACPAPKRRRTHTLLRFRAATSCPQRGRRQPAGKTPAATGFCAVSRSSRTSTRTCIALTRRVPARSIAAASVDSRLGRVRPRVARAATRQATARGGA
jgi:hypothetical protein